MKHLAILTLLLFVFAPLQVHSQTVPAGQVPFGQIEPRDPFLITAFPPVALGSGYDPAVPGQFRPSALDHHAVLQQTSFTSSSQFYLGEGFRELTKFSEGRSAFNAAASARAGFGLFRGQIDQHFARFKSDLSSDHELVWTLNVWKYLGTSNLQPASNHMLTSQAKQLVSRAPEFKTTYGTHYVSAIHKAQFLMIKVTVYNNSTKSTTQVKSSLKGAFSYAGIGSAKLDAAKVNDFKSQLTDVSYSVDASGAGNPADFLGLLVDDPVTGLARIIEVAKKQLADQSIAPVVVGFDITAYDGLVSGLNSKDLSFYQSRDAAASGLLDQYISGLDEYEEIEYLSNHTCLTAEQGRGLGTLLDIHTRYLDSLAVIGASLFTDEPRSVPSVAALRTISLLDGEAEALIGVVPPGRISSQKLKLPSVTSLKVPKRCRDGLPRRLQISAEDIEVHGVNGQGMSHSGAGLSLTIQITVNSRTRLARVFTRRMFVPYSVHNVPAGPVQTIPISSDIASIQVDVSVAAENNPSLILQQSGSGILSASTIGRILDGNDTEWPKWTSGSFAKKLSMKSGNFSSFTMKIGIDAQ